MQSVNPLSISAIKREAKGHLSGKWREVIQLHLIPVLISIVLTGGIYGFDLFSVTRIINEESEGSLLLNFLITFITVGITFALLDMVRSNTYRISPLKDSFQVFSSKYFVPVFIIQLLQVLFITLWSLLFLIPGIIKSFSYSQAFYVFKDKREEGVYPSALDCITISRELMNGHKLELFVLYLSFIGWFILEGITFGAAALYVRPYLNTSLAVFYDQLAANDVQVLSSVISEADDEEGFGEY
ncbi:MAG: DUF975 family protein [Alkalibacterium sp.]|nr:DUF975 family protein [Alkalibacterium sp.]